MVEIFLTDIDEANLLILTLQDRNAILERAALAAGRRCALRRLGRCDLDCLGRILCDVTGLDSAREPAP